MTDTTYHGRAERAAENATLKLVARLMMAVGVPICLMAGAFIGGEIWRTARTSADAVIRLDERVAGLVDRQIPHIVGLLNSRLDAQAQRIDTQERRNEGQDHRMEQLQQRLWMPPQRP